jgi:hypothetical protein
VAARNLRNASQMIGPAIESLCDAPDLPESDAPLLALARRIAATIDAMPDGIAQTMLPNHAGPLLKVLAELETRAVARRKPVTSKPSRLAQLRAANAAGTKPDFL